MKENIIYYCKRVPWGTIYGKADLSAPELIKDEEGDFTVYPTYAVVLDDERLYYGEGDDIDENFDSFTLEEIDDERKEDIYRIKEEKFEEILKKATEWMIDYNNLKACYETIKDEYK